VEGGGEMSEKEDGWGVVICDSGACGNGGGGGGDVVSGGWRGAAGGK